MTTTVQTSTDGGSTWSDIDYHDFAITLGTSDTQLCPEATIKTHVDEAISADMWIRIRIDGTTRFEGKTVSGGSIDENGLVTVEARHDIASVFTDPVTITGPQLADPTDADQEPTDLDVLETALAFSVEGQSYTLTYNGTEVLLDNVYEVNARQLKQVFRDMVDRRNYVWWVKPTGEEVVVEPRGNQGQWADLSATGDDIDILKFDEGSVRTVRNRVIVIGTGAEPPVEATSTNQTSIDNYGRQAEKYNVSYISEVSEAQAMADSLLITDPIPSAKVEVPRSAGAVEAPMVNYTLGIEDAGRNIDETGLLIERQTIKQGRATVAVGQGSGEGVANTNRRTKSAEDKLSTGTTSSGSSPTGTLQQWDKIDNTELQNGEFISFRLRIPDGKTLKVWAAGAMNASNSAPSGLTAEVDDETNSTNLVSENGKLTTGSPLGSVAGPVDVAFRVENDTGSTQRATGQFRYSL